jgi:hypothetical protein
MPVSHLPADIAEDCRHFAHESPFFSGNKFAALRIDDAISATERKYCQAFVTPSNGSHVSFSGIAPEDHQVEKLVIITDPSLGGLLRLAYSSFPALDH